MSKTTAIIFDLEGVIVDSEPLWSKADEEFLKRHNIPFGEYEEFWKPQLMGRSLPEGADMLRKHYGLKGSVEELTQTRRDIVKELFAEELTFIDGFTDFFGSILGLHKLGIATALEKKFIESVNSRLKLTSMFGKHIYSIEDIGFISKPNPDIFLHVAKKLKVDPINCIVVEDAPNGVEAAKRAGMKCIAITTSTTREKLGQADLVIDNYTQVDLNTLNG